MTQQDAPGALSETEPCRDDEPTPPVAPSAPAVVAGHTLDTGSNGTATAGADIQFVPPARVSPCVGVCRLDDASGLCLGCARTVDEITLWRDMDTAARGAVWRALPARLAAMNVSSHQLPWDGQMARRFVTESIRSAAGTWVLGVVGAVGEFLRAADEAVEIAEDGDTIAATTPRAALRVSLGRRVRATSLPGPTDREDKRRIVLSLPAAAMEVPMRDTIGDCGPDTAAIRSDDRDGRLFDMGLGRAAARFCVRTEFPPLIEALNAAVGETWQQILPRIAPLLVAVSPVRVIETGLGRVEIATPIPPPDGASPDGPHTHFLPDHIALGRDLPLGMEIPSAYAPGAIFYPA
ncbi:MAG: DUF1289 domain-containing protein [Rhodospirillaceae bacterium]|nr:DUF1289 domain-containing protein [Rhodospirillaceae bacterium]